jgi:hypothetical protein
MFCVVIHAKPKAKKEEKNKEVVLLSVDLSKGKTGGGKEFGGKFVKEGWTPVDPKANIFWDVPKGVNMKRGRIVLELTNLNPNEQIKGSKVNKNQFFGLNEKYKIVNNEVKEEGAMIRFRMGWYKQFKIEAHSGKSGTKWDEKPINPLSEPFDLKKTYVLEVVYDPTGFEVKVNGIPAYKQPWAINGFQSLQIGETYLKSLNAFPGPIYKKITYYGIPD